MTASIRRPWLGRALACALLVPLAAACAPPGSDDGDSGGGSAAGESVEFGAGDEAYVEALKDMDPVTLDLGGMTEGPKAKSSISLKEWSDAITERSGGKISFRLDYAGAKVPLPEMAAALKQGRTDVGMYIPAYQPETFPVANGVGSLALAGRGTPVSGRMATFATVGQIGLETPEVMAEAEAQGIHPLMPLSVPAHDTKLMCGPEGPFNTKAALSGTTTRISAAHQGGVLKSLGAAPVSMTIPELFQGLQRGVVDCAVNSLGSFKSQGYDQLIKSMAVGTEPGGDFGETPSSFGVSKKTWDSLPLAAQQLLFDSMIDYAVVQLESGWESQADTATVMREQGVKISEFDAEVTKAFQDFRKGFSDNTVKELEEVGVKDASAIPGKYDSLGEEWWSAITGDLGHATDYNWVDLDKQVEEYQPDARPFAEAFYDKALKQHRPE